LCQVGDEEELAAFDKRLGGPSSRPEYWRWKYFENPAGEGCLVVARVGGEIIGRLGFVPFRTRVQDRDIVGAQQVDVAILPEYRRGGIYFQLAQSAIAEGAERGIAFGFGFATEETRALSTDFLGFSLVGRVRRLVKVLDYLHYAGRLLGPRVSRRLRRRAAPSRRATAHPSPSPDEWVTAVDRFDELFDGLAAKVAPGRVMVVRDSAYLNWRYVDCPTVEYERYAARSKGKLRGFVVFHAYEDDGVVRGVIDELVCPPDHPELLKRLLSVVFSDLRAKGAVNATCWLPTGFPLGSPMRALGFRDREARNHLIVLANTTETLDFEHLVDDRNWYYTHGDSDYHMRSV
jgi:GNAT superfamily N-acetyltransferase